MRFTRIESYSYPSKRSKWSEFDLLNTNFIAFSYYTFLSVLNQKVLKTSLIKDDQIMNHNAIQFQ